MTPAPGKRPSQRVEHGGDLSAIRARFPDAPEPWIDLSTGINPVPYPVPALSAEAWTRLPMRPQEEALIAAAARRYGVPLKRNPHFPINTLMLMRGAVGLQLREPARFIAYCDAVFRAIWVHAQNLNDPATVGDVLHQAGFDPQALLAMTQDSEVKDTLKAVTQEAIDRGIFGAPTFFVGTQMFWGQDRIDFVKEALK